MLTSSLLLEKQILLLQENSEHSRSGYVHLHLTFPLLLTPLSEFFLIKIMEDIEYYDIPIYNFPYDAEEDDEETIQDNTELRVSVKPTTGGG